MAERRQSAASLYAALRTGDASGSQLSRARGTSDAQLLRAISIAKASTSSGAAPTVGHSGTLWKQGVGNRSWQRRWFVLSGHRLMWFENEQSTVPRRTIRLTHVAEDVVEVSAHGQHVFEVVGVDVSSSTNRLNLMMRSARKSVGDEEGDRYRVAAPSREEALLWLAAIHKGLGMEWRPPPAPLASPLHPGAEPPATAASPQHFGLPGVQASTSVSEPAQPSSEAESSDEELLPGQPWRAAAIEAIPAEEQHADVRPQDATLKDEMPQEETSRHATPQDSTPQDSTPQDATPADATPQDDAPPDITPQHATPPDAAPPDATPKDTTPQDDATASEGCSDVRPSADSGLDGQPSAAHAIQEEPSQRKLPEESPPEEESPEVVEAARHMAKLEAELAQVLASPLIGDDKANFETALLLCKQEELPEDLFDALAALIDHSPHLFVHRDEKSIAPVHWFCGCPAVNATLLDALFTTLPSAAACRDGRGILPLHWLAANDVATAEMVLVVLEANEAAVRARDHFAQYPLHWLCSASSRDARTMELLYLAYPNAVRARDAHGLTPIHWMCQNKQHHVESLRRLLALCPSAATLRDHNLQLPLHTLCRNKAATAESIQCVMDAYAGAVAETDDDGCLPLHYLSKYQPEAGDLLQLLMDADRRRASMIFSSVGSMAESVESTASMSNSLSAEASREQSSSSGAQAARAMPVMIADDGSVKGMVGRVRQVTIKGAELDTRIEDRGLLLFVSSMTAVKTTAEACRQACAMLDALLIKYDARDVFVNAEYASQLKRLAGSAIGARGKKELPSLPRLYLNGKLLGELDDLRQMDQAGELLALLKDYRMDFQKGREVDREDCFDCSSKRFIVCSECNGSKRGKSQVFGRYLNCSVCNENGLIPCPSCNADEFDRAMTSPMKNES